MIYYVYYLHSPEGELLYIGRSHLPIARKLAFERKHKIVTLLGVCQRHLLFENSQKAEREAIAKHRPKFNIYVASSASNHGKSFSQQTRRKMSVSMKGLAKSPQARINIGAAGKGKRAWNKGLKGVYKATPETRMKLSLKLLGNTRTKGKKQSKETIDTRLRTLRRKFRVKLILPCRCGCGGSPKAGNRFMQGHHMRMK